jgi:hypothetical protein
LSPVEKKFFLTSIERYRQGEVSICGPKKILPLLIEREGDKLHGNQTFFSPFLRLSMNPIQLKLIGGVISGENKAGKRESFHGLWRWHHQEVSALPVCRQDVNQWIERSFGDLVGH